MKDFIIFGLLIFSYSSLGHARYPAVEPVKGLSIDELSPSNPDQAVGYRFSERPLVLSSPPTLAQTTVTGSRTDAQRVPAYTQNDFQELEMGAITFALVLFLILAFPVCLWWATYFSYKQTQTMPKPIKLNPRKKVKTSSDKNDKKAA